MRNIIIEISGFRIKLSILILLLPCVVSGQVISLPPGLHELQLNGRSILGTETSIESTLPLWMKGYYSKKEQGFSSFSLAREYDWGTTIRYDFEQDKKGGAVTLTSEKEAASYHQRIGGFQVFTDLNKQTRTVVELQSGCKNNHDHKGETCETLVAIKVGHQLST